MHCSMLHNCTIRKTAFYLQRHKIDGMAASRTDRGEGVSAGGSLGEGRHAISNQIM